MVNKLNDMDSKETTEYTKLNNLEAKNNEMLMEFNASSKKII
jgi:hypothetical protein